MIASHALCAKLRVVTRRHEADLLRLRLVCRDQLQLARRITYLGFGELTDREEKMRQYFTWHAPKEVTLILIQIEATSESHGPRAGARARDDARVMTGCNRVRAELARAPQQVGNLRVRVAAHARIRRAALDVFVHEIVDHGCGERFFHVEHV